MTKSELMSADDMRRALKRMSHQIIERNHGAENIVLLGIRSRGIPLAKRLAENTFYADTWQEVEEIMEEKGGFVITKWCGDQDCELDMKDLAGVSSRCIPFKQRGDEGKCAICGKPCTTDIMWGVAY